MRAKVRRQAVSAAKLGRKEVIALHNDSSALAPSSAEEFRSVFKFPQKRPKTGDVA